MPLNFAYLNIFLTEIAPVIARLTSFAIGQVGNEIFKKDPRSFRGPLFQLCFVFKHVDFFVVIVKVIQLILVSLKFIEFGALSVF